MKNMQTCSYFDYFTNIRENLSTFIIKFIIVERWVGG